jgi:glycosyltransferase involved in cell wall biosynthesis
MKILIIHWRFFPVSGPERYLFNTIELLERNGHTVIPFSINYESNNPTEFDKYFVESVGDKNNFNFTAQSNISITDKIKIAKNFFYNTNAYENLNDLIRNEKPDIAYILQFFGKLSISIFDACYENKIPIVLRLSDYGLICSKNIFYRDGEVCTKCISNQLHSLRYKCVHQSLSKSVLFYLALQFSYSKKFQSKINTIVTPSLTMMKIFAESRYFKKISIKHVPTFFLFKDFDPNKKSRQILNIDFCYLGRIDEDKGVDVLINAVILLSEKGFFPKVVIAGDYNNQYASSLILVCKNMNLSNVEFTGLLKKDELLEVLSSSRFTIIPSLWYDNMPNSLIESQAIGVPVIASNIGSLPELITDNYNGFLFRPGDKNELANKMEQTLLLNDDKLETYKVNSYNWAREYCSEKNHYDKLINIFENAIK